MFGVVDSLEFMASPAVHLKLLACLAVCLSLLTGCAAISVTELDAIGSHVTPANIKFDELYDFAQMRNRVARRVGSAGIFQARLEAGEVGEHHVRDLRVVELESPGSA